MLDYASTSGSSVGGKLEEVLRDLAENNLVVSVALTGVIFLQVSRLSSITTWFTFSVFLLFVFFLHFSTWIFSFFIFFLSSCRFAFFFFQAYPFTPVQKRTEKLTQSH